MNKSLQDAIEKARQDPNGLSNTDLEYIYEQGRADQLEECKSRKWEQMLVELGKADERARVIEMLQQYIDTHKRHIFGIGISNVLDTDELVRFLIKLAEEQGDE